MTARSCLFLRKGLDHCYKEFDRFRDDGPMVLVRQWTQVDSNDEEICRKALIFISHGLGEHGGWYDELGQELAKTGFLVFSHDHGQYDALDTREVQYSPSLRSTIFTEPKCSFNCKEVNRSIAASWLRSKKSRNPNIHLEGHVELVMAKAPVCTTMLTASRNTPLSFFDHCDEIKKNYPDLPLFLFGHSMGGAVAISAALEKPGYFDGVITSDPFVVPTKGAPSKIEQFLIRYIISWICPQRKLLYIDSKEICRDPGMVRRFEEDPLVHPFLKAKWGVAWQDCSENIQQSLEAISCPFLALHGSADAISDVNFSRDLFDKATSQDKELKIYPGFLHAPLFEPEEDRKEVLDDIIQWLHKRIPTKE